MNPEELEILILDPGVEIADVAASMACCSTGPAALVHEPEPS